MTKKHNAPRVLTVDDGKQMIRKTNTSRDSHIFSSNIDDWLSTARKRKKCGTQQKEQ